MVGDENNLKLFVYRFSDGVKASGLYLALSFMIEQMKLEQECDVCLAVRSLRHSRKQFVTTEVNHNL